MKGLRCECEHEAHMEPQILTPNGNPGHDYGAGKFLNLIPVKTEYGTFHVCQDCKNDCLGDYK